MSYFITRGHSRLRQAVTEWVEPNQPDIESYVLGPFADKDDALAIVTGWEKHKVVREWLLVGAMLAVLFGISRLLG